MYTCSGGKHVIIHPLLICIGVRRMKKPWMREKSPTVTLGWFVNDDMGFPVHILINWLLLTTGFVTGEALFLEQVLVKNILMIHDFSHCIPG